MTYDIPDNLLYTDDHEWLRRAEDNPDEVTIGITEFAQEQLGDVVYLELPAEGTALTAGQPFGEIESAKTVAELFAPITGELIAINGELEERPELVNDDPTAMAGSSAPDCPTRPSWTSCSAPSRIASRSRRTNGAFVVLRVAASLHPRDRSRSRAHAGADWRCRPGRPLR